jgi:general secretion pathway protein G
MSALKLYRLDNQRIPPASRARGAGRQARAAARAAELEAGGYLEKLPKDPWGRPYVYLNPACEAKSR